MHYIKKENSEHKNRNIKSRNITFELKLKVERLKENRFGVRATRNRK